jgi:hypothetical protein
MKEKIVKEYEFEDYMKVKDSYSKEELCETLSFIKRGYIPNNSFSGTEEDYESYRLEMALYKAIDYISGRNEVIWGENN